MARDHRTITYTVAAAGGVAAPPRRRAARVLQASEREEISRGVAAGWSLRQVARHLGRAPSTISRELRRHGGRQADRAAHADRRAWARSRRPKPCRLARHPWLRRLVATKLVADWAPQQISGWLKTTFPADPTRHVSHDTIYRSLFVQARGALKRALVAHLRRARGVRRAQRGSRHHGRGQIVDAVSIRERPAAVEDRAVPGHWEGDLLCGTQQSQILTLVERASRYVVLVRVPSKDTATVIAALTRRVQRLPQGLMTSLTWDRGLEMAAHRTFSVATDVQVYFCDPRRPWQRGSNENTNGLLRQYFPKGADLSQVTQAQLDRVALRLNTRPRQTLGFQAPTATLAATVASIP